MALDIGYRQLESQVRTARLERRSTPTVVIVGAGLSGLAAAIQLLRSGLSDVTIVEQSEGVGGTWRDNDYPGSG
jgi:cation diffusion facilitator CzcD-associated flavoprotein CzcO